MALFDPPAVKALRKQTEVIGGMHAQVFLGHLPAADLDDYVRNEDIRARLRSAYADAVAEVGEKKAMKAAVSEARMWAEAAARQGTSNYSRVMPAAENSVRAMLGDAAPRGDIAPPAGRRGQREQELTSRRYLAAAPPGPRMGLLSAACILQATSWPSAAPDRSGDLVGEEELGRATEQVRLLMTQDRDLSAAVTRRILIELHHALRGGGSNEDMFAGERSIDLLLLALHRVGLEASGHPERGDVRVAVWADNPASGKDAAAAVRVGGQALAVLFGILSIGSRRDRQLYVELYSGCNVVDVEMLAYTITAWAAILMARLINTGVLAEYKREYAKVVPLGPPGWYPNPTNTGPIVDGDAVFQRFWDGQWSDQARIRRDGRWVEETRSLHIPPTE